MPSSPISINIIIILILSYSLILVLPVISFALVMVRFVVYLFLSLLFSSWFLRYCICFILTEVLSVTASLPSQGRSKAAYKRPSPNPTCGTTLGMMLFLFFQGFFFTQLIFQWIMNYHI